MITECYMFFCAINHGRYWDRPICDRNVNEIIKKSVVKVKRCERPSDLDVSGHSLRVGAAQDLLIKGYDLAAIMRAGGCRMQKLFPGTCGFLRIIFLNNNKINAFPLMLVYHRNHALLALIEQFFSSSIIKHLEFPYRFINEYQVP